jgi:serine/threonine-protein kinase HipA
MKDLVRMNVSDLKSITTLYVYKDQTLVGELSRTKHGAEFLYYQSAVDSGSGEKTENNPDISFLMPYRKEKYEIKGDNLHTFFAGLLPEGRRLEVLYETIKTARDDLFSLLAASGPDVIGDISVSIEKEDFTDTGKKKSKEKPVDLSDVIFKDIFETSIFEMSLEKKRLDSSFPGVYPKISAEMISFPVSIKKHHSRHILKLEPEKFPHLISNEHFFMKMATACGVEAAKTMIVYDREKNPALLVERFDRMYDKNKKMIKKLHQEDACQFLDYYPADKYRISLREVAEGVERFASAPIVELTKLLKQIIFSYIIGNGDMHGKNISLGNDITDRKICLTPAYDIISTVPYGDEEMALHIEGKKSNIRRKDFIAFAERVKIPPAATSSILNRVLENAGKWIERYNEIGLDEKKTAYLRNISLRRIKDLYY